MTQEHGRVCLGGVDMLRLQADVVLNEFLGRSTLAQTFQHEFRGNARSLQGRFANHDVCVALNVIMPVQG